MVDRSGLLIHRGLHTSRDGCFREWNFLDTDSNVVLNRRSISFLEILISMRMLHFTLTFYSTCYSLKVYPKLYPIISNLSLISIYVETLISRFRSKFELFVESKVENRRAKIQRA